MAWPWREVFASRLQTQRPGLPADGPLTPALQAMAEIGPGGEPVSPVGADLARLVGARTIRVAFLPTGGSAATPWRSWVVLDVSYRGPGQASSPARVGLVAHELTHLLQRELDDRQFWPGGGLRLSTTRRWLGDSTNYMEALAYLAGGSVEIDLLEAEGLPVGPRLLDDLATFAAEDAVNAVRYVLKRFPDNAVYRRNQRVEARALDRRIPPDGWGAWLGRIGFSAPAIERILSQAARGTAVQVDRTEIERSLTG